MPSKEKRVVVEEAWPLPAVVVAYHITYDGHPDSYPLHILSKVLSDGQSSRIYRKLVYETGQALTAFGGGNIIENPNLFFAVAIVNPDTVSRRPWRRRSSPSSSGSRPKASPNASCSGPRTSLRATTSSGANRSRTRPTHLAHAEVIHADITTADGEFDIFQKITAADVQRVARTYFAPDHRVVLHVMPKGGGR